MKEIKVLGSGCAKCVKTAEIIQIVADMRAVEVNIIKETSPEVMMHYGVMSTPAVVVDDVLVHKGSIPDQKKIQSWL
jgi:hypothetical protein